MDWDQVAAIVAIVAIVLNLPTILGPIYRKIHAKIKPLFHRGYRCDVIRWDDLHDRKIALVPSLISISSTTSELGSLTADSATPFAARRQLSDLDLFLSRVWRATPHPITPRPSYLPPDKNFLCLDLDTLVVALLVDGTIQLGSKHDKYLPGQTSFSISYGTVRGRFYLVTPHPSTSASSTAVAPYITAHLTNFPHHDYIRPSLRGLTKTDLLLIAQGYPPFYRKTFTAKSGAAVRHPVKEMRDIHRGAWLVAIGFSVDPPLVVYNSRKMSAYAEACGRVLHTLTRLRGLYKEHAVFGEMLEVAVKGVTRMNGNGSGSGLPSVLEGSLLAGCEDSGEIGNRLSAGEIGLAMKLFGEFDEGPVREEDRERVERIMVEVVKAAVSGVYVWWQYVNNHSNPMPGWMYDERIRHCPVWLEDGGLEEQPF